MHPSIVTRVLTLLLGSILIFLPFVASAGTDLIRTNADGSVTFSGSFREAGGSFSNLFDCTVFHIGSVPRLSCNAFTTQTSAGCFTDDPILIDIFKAAVSDKTQIVVTTSTSGGSPCSKVFIANNNIPGL